ncbi:MAG: hypothetical protein WCS23_03155 [Defluviitoga tunisiensis]
MKKFFISAIVLLFSLLCFSQVRYDLGFSVLNEKSEFDLALRVGLESNDFNFSFDFSPSFNDTLSLITIMDVSAKIWEINDNLSLDAGLLWMNDKSKRGTYAYSALDIYFKGISSKICVGYPFKSKKEFLDYFVIKIGYEVPKPLNFIDDLKMELRLVNGRIDFSIFLVEPF